MPPSVVAAVTLIFALLRCQWGLFQGSLWLRSDEESSKASPSEHLLLCVQASLLWGLPWRGMCVCVSVCVCVNGVETSEKITFFQTWGVGLTSSGSHDATFTVLIFLRKKKSVYQPFDL